MLIMDRIELSNEQVQGLVEIGGLLSKNSCLYSVYVHREPGSDRNIVHLNVEQPPIGIAILSDGISIGSVSLNIDDRFEGPDYRNFAELLTAAQETIVEVVVKGVA
jgi:hypothetical protein